MSEASTPDKSKDFVKLSASQVTVGGISVATLLVLNTFFYSKEAGQTAALRIDKNEQSIKQLEQTVNTGFEKLRDDIKNDIKNLTILIQGNTFDRWTRSDHQNYSTRLESRLDKIETRLHNVETQKKK